MSTENETNQSPTLGALAAALAKAQGSMASAKKDATNPHFGKTYADLASVWDACRGPLSANELAIVQKVATGTGGVLVTTMLLHSSGEWIQDKFLMPVQANTAQGVGAAVTYGRRYALSAMVGVAPDDDDDGNEATKLAPPLNQQSGKKEHRPVSNRQVTPKKDEPAPAGESKETEAALLTTKVRRLWANFNKAGGTTPDWEPWLAQSIGERRTSKTLTLADCAKLEMELANGLKLISEPPSDPAPPPPSEPKADEPVNPPGLRFSAMAGELRMKIEDLRSRAQGIVGKREGFTHADIDKIWEAVKAVGK